MAKTKSYLAVSDFCEKYELRYNAFVARKSQGYFKGAWEGGGKGHPLFVNEKFFIRRKEFRRKVQLFNQEMYHHLMDNKYSELRLGRMVHAKYGLNPLSTSVWLNGKLFASIPESYTKYKLSGTEWGVFKLFRSLFLGMYDKPKHIQKLYTKLLKV